jgi:hypothetical protein
MIGTDLPKMIPYPGIDPSIERRLTMFDERIHKSPEEFLDAIKDLGDTMLAGTLDLSERDRRVPRAVRKPELLLAEYFENRYDLEHTFDDDTEQALGADEENASLIAVVQKERSVTVRTGITRSERRPNENAVPAREALRRHRLAFYVGRVSAAAEAEVEAQPQDPFQNAG